MRFEIGISSVVFELFARSSSVWSQTGLVFIGFTVSRETLLSHVDIGI
jgi:hypothetical protein